MPIATDEEMAARYQRIGDTAARARFERALILPEPEPTYSYAEKLGSMARQENLALVIARAAQRPTFSPEPGFEPRDHLAEFSGFTDQFPQLLRAGSQAELVFHKNRVIRELRDRRTLENVGFLESLALMPAVLWSPENALPIGTGLRAAGFIGKQAVKRAATRGLLRSMASTGGRVGVEAAAAQAVAESVLLGESGFRTVEESAINTAAAGLLGALLGGGAGGIGFAKSKALRELAGVENFGEIAVARDKAVAKILDPRTPLGQKAREVHGLFEDSPEDFTFAADSPLRGLFLEALEEDNPKLARLVALDNRVGRFITKGMIFQPAMRLARSEVEQVREIGKVLTGHFLHENVPIGAQGLSVEGKLELAGMGAVLRQKGLEEVYHAHRAKLAGLTEGEAWSMVGHAMERGDRVTGTLSRRDRADFDAFARIRENQDAIAAIEDMAKETRTIFESFFRTAKHTGAYTEGPARQGSAKEILSALTESYLPRSIDKEYTRQNLGTFRGSIQDGLEARKALLPEFEEKRAEFSALLEEATDEADRAHLEQEIADLDEAVGMLTDNFDDTVFSIEENFMGRAPDRPAARPNPYAARVLDIESRFLEQFREMDPRVLTNRIVRSVLPDMLLADAMDNRLGTAAPLQRQLPQDLAALDERVEKSREYGIDLDSGSEINLTAGDVADKALHMRLANQVRLLRRSTDDLVAMRQQIADAMDVRSRERRSRATMRAELATVRQEIAALKELGEDTAELEARRAELNASIAESLQMSDAASFPLKAIAKRIGDQVGASARSGATRIQVPRHEYVLAGTLTAEQIQRRVDTVNALVHAQVATARKEVFDLNVDTEHLMRAVERAYARRYGENLPDKIRRRMEKEQAAIETEILRLRNRHGVNEDSDFATWGRRIREFNYMTKMGSVLLSSLPDIALAVSTAGMVPYANAVARSLGAIFTGKFPKNTGADMIHAIERGLGILRTEKILGVDDEFVPSNAFDRGLKRTSEAFTNLTLIKRWNAFHKGVAYQAIESRVTRALLEGEGMSKQDRAMMGFLGVNEANFADMKRVLETMGSSEPSVGGQFFLSNSRSWRSETPELAGFRKERLRELRLELEGAIMKGVQDTIITPSVGDLPSFATKHPMGRMLLQFRSFSLAVQHRFLIPGIQRTFGKGDPGPAAAFLLASTMGMFVYGLHAWLKGQDPLKQPEDGEPLATKLILEGIDRGGGFGLLSEFTSSMSKILGIGYGPTSRFASRNTMDAFLGPALGLGEDILGVAGTFGRDDFTSADAARIRRLIPMQNLLILRALLDVGPTVPDLGTRDYYRNFRKVEQRAAGAVGLDVN